MSISNNIPTVLVRGEKAENHMNQDQEVDKNCKFCGSGEGVTLVAILNDNTNEIDELDPEKVLWLCEDHYRKIIESEEYRIREIPNHDFELGHTMREEVSEPDGEYVTILKPDSDDKWLQAPDKLELNLKKER